MFLPEMPADLKTCFSRRVPAPPPGSLTERQAGELVARLKQDGDDKRRCGLRFACWYDDVRAAYVPEAKRGKPDPACVVTK